MEQPLVLCLSQAFPRQHVAWECCRVMHFTVFFSNHSCAFVAAFTPYLPPSFSSLHDDGECKSTIKQFPSNVAFADDCRAWMLVIQAVATPQQLYSLIFMMP